MTASTVLVLDGDENQAVASVRDLAAAGYRVIVGDCIAMPKAALSRYADRQVRYRSPRTDADGFIADLLNLASSEIGPGGILLPMTEATTLALSLNRQTLLGAGLKLILPRHEDLLLAFDKHASGTLARSLGLLTPEELLVSDEDSLGQATQLRHPVVIKAVSSNTSTSSGLVRNPRPRYSTTPRDTVEHLRSVLHSRGGALVQEFVTGTGVGFFALYRHGKLERSFAHRRLRDVHPTGSGSSYRESIPVSQPLEDAGSTLLTALNWHGAAMVEFKQCEDGRLVFIEVNGRLWGSLALAVAAGATFPRWLARLANDESLLPHPQIRAGVRARWLLGDFRHLIAVARGRPKGFPGPFPTLSNTLREMCRGLSTDYFDNFRGTDPLPELGDWLSVTRKALTRRGSSP